ncbi:iron ABC transporter permease [Paenibacillus sp. IB182496]|uniref:Iron ABC transporter permease n=1 Tax=Paenibacillus sabuli TaxID=2772509 RepID=A0A927BVL1_9BACL|nr:iron ABC transporter permease [Paenibacillus sabuli]MBD2846711.1 iron ABC transporter permease [Paenibacillus sabuli]
MASSVQHSGTDAGAGGSQLQSRPLAASAILIGGTALLAFGIALSISFGAASIGLKEVWGAMFAFNPELTNHQIIQELRMPRAVAAALVGAALAVAGTLMQGMTRNPLADSGLLGINAGAGFVLAVCFAFFPGLSFGTLILFSFVGAGLGAGLVFGVGSLAQGGLSPVRLAIAGAAVTALLTALSEGIALHFQIGQDLAFWYAGGVQGVQWKEIMRIGPWIVAALAGSMLLSRSITVLSLGEEVAASLGQRNRLVKALASLAVLVLAGAAVAVAGMIGFVGLMIPHLTRYLVGRDYRWIISCSAVLGALLLVLGDLAARMINPPEETPVAALIALIGVPFFLYLARNERREL